MTVARVVTELAPDPQDEIVRRGLIHVAMGRMPARDGGFAEAALVSADCLGKALHTRPFFNDDTLTPALARTLATALSTYAGDVDDPTGGARFVTHHQAEIPDEPLGPPCALLGDFLFFK